MQNKGHKNMSKDLKLVYYWNISNVHNADDIILTAKMQMFYNPNNESQAEQWRKIDLRLNQKETKLMATGT